MLPLAAASSSSPSSILRRAALAPLILRRPMVVRTMAANSGDANAADARPPRRQQQQRAPSNTTTTPDAASAADRARRRTRYKNNWQRRSADELAPQVVMRAPFPSDPSTPARVAIVGGGVAGLVCARELASLGIRSVVFDTGERGPGGRLATRTTADGSFFAGAAVEAGAATAPPLAFDHAAQFFTADETSEFAALARSWVRRGWVKEWSPDRVVRLNNGAGGGETAAVATSPALPQPPYYVPATAGGFRALARSLADDADATGLVELRCGAWVSSVTADAERGKWRVAVRKASSGGGGGQKANSKNNARSNPPPCADPSGAEDPLLFDAVVIAHNGKCANRLAAPMGSPLVAQQLMRLRLSAAWVAMLAFERSLGLKFEGAFVDGSGELAWAGNNTKKLGLAATSGGGDKADQQQQLECWTLVSTDAYAQRRKVPQERIPADVARAVASELAEALSRAAGLPSGLPPLAAPPRVQLWGAALPLNSPGVPAVLDPAARVGICGDWLLGAGVQAAAVSGLELARRLAALRGVPMERCVKGLEDDDQGGLAVGLRTPFAPLGARTGPCGEFPTTTAGGGGVEKEKEQKTPQRAAPPMLAARGRR
jgi:predicted NAD/FAD-dependent oxidoreductase